MSNNSKFDSAKLWEQVCDGASGVAKEEKERDWSHLKPPAPLPPKSSGLELNVQETLPEKIDDSDEDPALVLSASLVDEQVTAVEVPDDRALVNVEPESDAFDLSEQVDRELFPHQPVGDSRSHPMTLPNLRYLLRQYGITVRYNMVKRTAEIMIPGLVTSVDNAKNNSMAQLKSLARQNGLSTAGFEENVLVLADQNPYTPVADWILSKPWDGKDRLEDFYATLIEQEGYGRFFKNILIRRWMISAIAAVFLQEGFKSRGVLTLQGAQGIGKTSWFASLVPDIALRSEVVMLDLRIDAGNKDCIIAAASHWLVELGELEGSFRKNIDRLKGFITNTTDKVRVPYARTASEFQRRTVFGGSVNDERFLVDSTGNSRWWVIPLENVNYDHSLDMQQIWAQVKTLYDSGEQWWLTPEEEDYLENSNRDHRVVSVVEERVMPLLDLSKKNEEGLPAMTPTELLSKAGYKYVSNPQAKECGTLLRYHLGPPKKINGYMKWRIPLFKQKHVTNLDDLY